MKDRKKRNKLRITSGNIIRDSIIAEIKKSHLTKPEMIVLVKSVMSAPMFYAYMRGENDIGTRRASKLLKVLNLSIAKVKRNDGNGKTRETLQPTGSD